MSEAHLVCPSCAHANRVAARFCEECGGALVPSCPTCGAEVSRTARYCDSCGASLHPAELGAGRKVVTVLFADLAGSTAFQERLDAESVRTVMARFYQTMRAVIEEHEGCLEKFIGDAVVAVFGMPIVREDDALRAVRAAAAMASALERLNDELERDFGVRLDMRIGVNTGELVLAQRSGDAVPDDSDIVVGDVMNTAARLQQTAGAGEVFIGEDTRRLVRHALQLEPMGHLELKGKSEPVPAWRLVPAGPGRDTEEISTETPLVGRQSELARVRAALDDAVAARACRLVTVIGSPGVGKTRLAQELARDVGEQAVVVEGHCEPSGEGITLLPVAEVLRSLAGIGEADAPETVREKLGALVQDDAERERLVERVAGVLGVAAPASAQETFWALRRGLELVAARKPIVIVLDDLHWGQPMFLDLVEHLIEWVRDAPVLLLALARPELRELREALTSSGRRASDVIELSPLDEGESRALVSGLLGGGELPPELRERILRSSEGNPLFLGEMLRMLIDEGAIQREQESWVGGSDLAAIEVPATIHALLSARIERLDSDERSVVERAAVIGKEFYRGAVAELVAPPVKPRIDGHLEALRRKDMVEPEGTYWIDEPVYRFHHVLLRDAAYRSLLKEARAELHERFADWLREKAGELVGEHEEVIAFHLQQAHSYRRELGPLDDRGRKLGERAAARLHSAGQRALVREDLAAAANLLTRALECDAGAEQEILWDLCEALLSAGDAARAEAFVGRFSKVAGDDRGQCARAQVLDAQLANLSGAEQAAESAKAVTGAAESLAELGDRHGEAKAWHVAAGAHVRLGQVGAVEEALDRALAAARAADDRRRLTAVLTGAPRAALWGPSPVVRASGRCLDVVRILRMTPGNRHVEAIALRCQAVLEAMRTRFDAAREILASGRATLEELGLTLELLESQVHAGIVELLAGEPHAAADHLREARVGFESLGVSSGAAQAAALLARALVEQSGNDEEAIEQTRFAEENCGEDLKTTITWCSARAQALARRGDLDQAIDLARHAVALAEPTDALADKADAAIAMAEVLLAAGHTQQARAAARAALELYEAKGHSVGAERAARLAGPARARAPVSVARAAERPHGPLLLDGLAPERWYAELVGRVAEHDLRGALQLYAEDWVFLDHRSLGWDPAQGLAEAEQLLGSGFESSPDFELVVDEVLACDERVIAIRQTWRGHTNDGGGEYEVRVGLVNVIEHGLLSRSDQYDHDDRDGMLARYAELAGGRSAVLGDRPPERWYSEYARRIATHDLARCLELYAQDHVMADHRSLSWEPVRGRASVGELLGSAFASVPDIEQFTDEVLACDERVIAVRVTWRGHGLDGGGEAELAMGIVNVVEDGLLVSTDQYDHDDDAAMLARYAELGGARDALVGDRAPERFFAEYRRRAHARDYAGIEELIAADCNWTDHRALSWEQVSDRDQVMAIMHSTFDASPNLRMDFDEVLACDERVLAVCMVWRGQGLKAGPWQVEAGAVCSLRDGKWASSDFYEPDDRQAIVARYAELGGGLTPLGERPPERAFAELARTFASRDVEALREMHVPDFRFVDHRRLGWQELSGRDAVAANASAAWEQTLDLRYEVDEVLACDERVIAARIAYRGHMRDGGGELEFAVGMVNVVEGGMHVSGDRYDPDDREAMLARYAELGGTNPPAAMVATADSQATVGDRQSAQEKTAHWGAPLANDVSLFDRRPDGWGTLYGSDAVAARLGDSLAGTSLLRTDWAALVRHADGWFALALIGRGELAYVEILREERAARERYGALVDDPEGAITVRLGIAWIQALNRRDRGAARACLHDDMLLVEHRRASTFGRETSAESYLDQIFGTVAVADDIQWWWNDVIEDRPGLAGRTEALLRGHLNDGGGSAELRIDLVYLRRGERIERFEMYPPDALAEQRARVAELAVQVALRDEGPTAAADLEERGRSARQGVE